MARISPTSHYPLSAFLHCLSSNHCAIGFRVTAIVTGFFMDCRHHTKASLRFAACIYPVPLPLPILCWDNCSWSKSMDSCFLGFLFWPQHKKHVRTCRGSVDQHRRDTGAYITLTPEDQRGEKGMINQKGKSVEQIRTVLLVLSQGMYATSPKLRTAQRQ